MSQRELPATAVICYAGGAVTTPAYELVRLRSGTLSIRSSAEGETMHPAIGPAAEAELLYVRQLRLAGRLAVHEGEFVIWDVGLGAAANAMAVLHAASQTSGAPHSLRLLSFDHLLDPLRFALQHVDELDYLRGREEILGRLLNQGEVAFDENGVTINWLVHVHDFPSMLAFRRKSHATLAPIRTPQSALRNRDGPPDIGSQGQRVEWPAPHAILFDPFSPAKNPAMWTAPLFADLYRWLDPRRPCSLATYSRSTMIRTALLLAGFFVGAGQPSGQKEETTIAANTLELIEEPLDRRWLERARRSDAAEPLRGPVYRRAKLSAATWKKLRAHPQFNRPGPGPGAV